MLYIIKEIYKDIFNYERVTVLHIAQTEEEVWSFLSNPENIKGLKGDLKIDKVVL